VSRSDDRHRRVVTGGGIGCPRRGAGLLDLRMGGMVPTPSRHAPLLGVPRSVEAGSGFRGTAYAWPKEPRLASSGHRRLTTGINAPRGTAEKRSAWSTRHWSRRSPAVHATGVDGDRWVTAGRPTSTPPAHPGAPEARGGGRGSPQAFLYNDARLPVQTSEAVACRCPAQPGGGDPGNPTFAAAAIRNGGVVWHDGQGEGTRAAMGNRPRDSGEARS